MFTILINNSVSKLEPKLPKYFENKLVRELSYFDEKTYFNSKQKKKSYITLFDINTYVFPTGLLKRIATFFSKENLNLRFLDERKVPQRNYHKFKMRISEPNAYLDQTQALRALLESPSGRGICVLPTGVGKTRVMKDCAQNLGVNTLIVEPGLNLKSQVWSYLTACFGPEMVGFADGGKKVYPITVSNLDSLVKLPQEFFDQFDCVIFDEYHHEACATARMINEKKFGNIYYKYAFTATNFRNSKSEQILLDSVMANEVYSITPIQAIERGYILPIRYFHEVIPDKLPSNYDAQPFRPSDDELSDMWERKKKSMQYHQVYKHFIVNEEQRNERIISQAKRLIDEKVPTLILVKEIEHGKLLQSEIPDSIFVNGQNDKEFNSDILEQFNQGNIPNIIGTSVIGEGIDTKCAQAVILGNAEKAESKIMQNIGRVVRTFPGQDVGYVYDFFDEGHDTMLKHSKRRKSIVKKHFNQKPIVL